VGVWFGTSSNAATAKALVTAAFVTLACMSIPHLVLINDVESAWSFALANASARGLQFGKDLVFTYGPLGFLVITYFSGYATALRFLVDGLLCFSVASGVCLLSWRLALGWRLLAIGLFTIIVASVLYGTQDLLIDVGLFSWALLCVLETRSRATTYAGVLVFLVVFAALVKITCMIEGALTIAVVSLEFWLRRKRFAALAIPTLCGWGFLAGWLLTGQSVGNLVSYLTSSFIMSKGYSSCMSITPPVAVLVGGLLTALTTLGVIAFCSMTAFGQTKRFVWFRRLLIMTWATAITFLIWKHSFVRADPLHVVFFFGFAPIAALLLLTLPNSSAKIHRWTQVLVLGSCICSISTLQGTFHPPFLDIHRPVHVGYINARSLFQRSEYIRQMENALRTQEGYASLPHLRKIVGNSTVDVFGNHQCTAFWNELNYRPRPVFQSYAAYTLPLMQLNERFYSSKAAPKFVLSDVWSIDTRFPPMEDALAFRYLLINYELVGREGEFMLLKSRGSSSAQLTLLDKGTILPGERIDLKRFGQANIWLQLSLDETFVGKVRETVYQPPQPNLMIWVEGQTPVAFGAPAPMMKAGFLASPLLSTGEQLNDFLSGRPVSRPAAYSIEIGKGDRLFWKLPIHYQVYRIENPLGDNAKNS